MRDLEEIPLQRPCLDIADRPPHCGSPSQARPPGPHCRGGAKARPAERPGEPVGGGSGRLLPREVVGLWGHQDLAEFGGKRRWGHGRRSGCPEPWLGRALYVLGEELEWQLPGKPSPGRNSPALPGRGIKAGHQAQGLSADQPPGAWGVGVGRSWLPSMLGGKRPLSPRSSLSCLRTCPFFSGRARLARCPRPRLLGLPRNFSFGSLHGSGGQKTPGEKAALREGEAEQGRASPSLSPQLISGLRLSHQQQE